MEEEECDYRTPIGKVLKHINTLCKKPQIDDRLSEALDLFTEKLNEQENYLANGIIKINFAEAALFLQSSTELYGKRIDALWDELLELHTRLITYDCEDKIKKGLAVDKEVIEKLEERRNRYKRKKKFKLMLKQSEAKKFDFLIFDEDKENKEKKNPEDEKGVRTSWREYECESRRMRRIPNIVYKQMLQRYNMKNYSILKCLDFEIWDPEDDDFNTRYSRVPSWHHIHHLFEYNDKGLLPDNNNIIARLRLNAYARLRFMASRGIPLNSPFEKYKEEYLAYREQFFAEEAKKWQNMPLDTLEDLRKQLQYLAQKDRAEKGEPVVVGETVKLGRYGVKVVDQPIENDKIEILDTSDEDSLFELSVSCDRDFVKSDLYVRLEKLSSDILNKKLRQDSGFFDFDSDSDNHDCDDVNLDSNEGGEGAATVTDGDSAVNKDATVDVAVNNEENVRTDAIDGDSTDINQDKDTTVDTEKEICRDGDGTNTVNQDINDNTNADVCQDDIVSNQMNDHNYAEIPKPDDDIADVNHDNFDTRSFISDHDYCRTIPQNLEINAGNNDNGSGIEGNTENARSDPTDNTLETNNSISEVTTSLNKTVEETFAKPLSTTARIVPKIVKITERKEKRETPKETSNCESPPKRRKLSQKQIDKLLQGKIKPVKLKKFENFFSMNYLSEFGEGDVPIVDYESDYESDQSEAGNPDVDLLQENHANENDARVNPPVFDDHSDTRSVHSDHDYCRTATDTYNDSGFLEATNSQLSSESTQNDQQENSSSEPNTAQSTAEEEPILSFEEELERMRAFFNEKAKTIPPKSNTEVEQRPPTERELQEIEAEKARERVEEWRNTITPILRGLKDEEFDIHQYGSKIMDGLEINESKPFSDMVQGKPSAEVVRYFISSLQLANTNNIEICGAQQGQLSNDTYHVKLLTRDRYHEHLNEYLAPSVETLREKLDRMRAMNADKVCSGEPPTKKFKLMVPKPRAKRNARTETQKMKAVVKNTKKPLSSSNHNVQVIPEEKIETTQRYQIRPCKVVLNPIAQEQISEDSNVDRSQEKFNNSENERRERLRAKGKSIIKRHTVSGSQEPYVLNADISVPSTSRHVTWSRSSIRTYSNIDPQMPSTSFQRSPSPDSDMEFSYNFQVSSAPSDDVLFNQTRRECTEESFRERLVAVQEMNPDVQLQSTPHTHSPSKQLKTSTSLRRSLMFE